MPNGATDDKPACAADPCGTFLGNFWETTTDLAIGGRGPGLALDRTYDTTRAAEDGPLGFGWRHSYDMRVESQGGVASVVQENGARVPFFAPYAYATLGDVSIPYQTTGRFHGSLHKHSDGTWRFVRRGVEIFDFDADGKLTKIRDRNGHETTLAYNGAGRVATATDSSGRSLTFGYNGAGRLTSVTDPAGRVVRYTYTIAGDLRTVTDVGGGVTTYGYDTAHRVTSKLDPNQQALPTNQRRPVRNGYDSQGRVVWQDDREGKRTTFAYGSFYGSPLTTVTDPKGNVRGDLFNAKGLRTHVIYGQGTSSQSLWTFEHDPRTWGISKVTDPLGNATSISYDTRGNPLTVTDPLGRTTTATYNNLNQPLTVKDPSNVTSTFTYDSDGNVVGVAAAGGVGPVGDDDVSL